MSNEIDEETKDKIAKKYADIMNQQKIINAAEEVGVSEATFHKYKNYEKKKEEKTELEVDEGEDFDEKVKPDNDEDDDDDDDEVVLENIEIV